MLPFSASTFGKNDKYSPFQVTYPCKKCGIDCVSDCVQCNKCSSWVHYDCAELTDEEIEFYNVPENDFFVAKDVKLSHVVAHLI